MIGMNRGIRVHSLLTKMMSHLFPNFKFRAYNWAFSKFVTGEGERGVN